MEKFSELIIKWKLRLHQLAGRDTAEIIVLFTNDEINKLLEESEPWQRTCTNFLGETNNNYPKSERIWLIKRTNLVLSHIVWEKPITRAPTYYTDTNITGRSGYKSEDLSKVKQSPYGSVQKSELYAILMVLRGFKILST